MIRKQYENLDTFALDNQENYIKAEPFPHIVIDDLFEEETLDKIISEFPNNLDVKGENYNNRAEKKVTLNDLEQLSITTNNFINYLNSSTFLEFLQKLTNIKETLIPDPYLIGGGLHELKNDGFLNIH